MDTLIIEKKNKLYQYNLEVKISFPYPTLFSNCLVTTMYETNLVINAFTKTTSDFEVHDDWIK